MTTQRDRLAKLICESRHYPLRDVSDEEIADALLASGVRVVDVETLAAACHRAEKAGAFGFHDGSGCVHDEWATDILAALAGEAAS